MHLHRCSRCHAFLPPTRTVCTYCRQPSTVQKVVALLAGSALSVTLAACYGAPCTSNVCQRNDDYPCADESTDTDKDGFCGQFDCNEGNASIHEDAPDMPGDNVDQNCDGVDGVDGTTGATGITGVTGPT